ncbi:hypothetical protein SCUP234_02408 [Seiridium cupressi]
MMLTLKQPVHYGYCTVHDLPTPPSTSRPSPPVTIQEIPQKPLPPLPQRNSPSIKEMPAPHRGLPLPAAMTLPQPNPQPGPGHHPAPGPHSLSQPPPPPLPPAQSHPMGALPAAPQWQGQGAEESMRTWLVAKTEEERRRQEEEKTRQETLRLEQRRLEHDMLRTSLDRGIPPPMVPMVFAGMSGGVLPQAALEWAQQYLAPQHGHQPQLPPAQGTVSPEHRRDSQSHGYGAYAGSVGVPSTPGSGPGPQGGGRGGWPSVREFFAAAGDGRDDSRACGSSVTCTAARPTAIDLAAGNTVSVHLLPPLATTEFAGSLDSTCDTFRFVEKTLEGSDGRES